MKASREVQLCVPGREQPETASNKAEPGLDAVDDVIAQRTMAGYAKAAGSVVVSLVAVRVLHHC